MIKNKNELLKKIISTLKQQEAESNQVIKRVILETVAVTRNGIRLRYILNLRAEISVNNGRTTNYFLRYYDDSEYEFKNLLDRNETVEFLKDIIGELFPYEIYEITIEEEYSLGDSCFNSDIDMDIKEKYFANYFDFDTMHKSLLSVPLELSRLRDMLKERDVVNAISVIDFLIKKYERESITSVDPVCLKEEWISKLSK